MFCVYLITVPTEIEAAKQHGRAPLATPLEIGAHGPHDASLAGGRKLPKIIWSYWHAGPTPWAVDDCLATWSRHASDWEVRLLHAETISAWLDKHDDYPENVWTFSPAHQSDIFGLALLRRYGGLYMDVSIILMQPLQWLEDRFERDGQGYFGYKNTHGTPEIFLLASEPRGACVSAWWSALHTEWAKQVDGSQVEHLRPGAIGTALSSRDAGFGGCIAALPTSTAGPYMLTRHIMQATGIKTKEELVPALTSLTAPLPAELLAEPLHKIQGAAKMETGSRPGMHPKSWWLGLLSGAAGVATNGSNAHVAARVSHIAIVTHHKSGTYVAMLLIGALCCPEAPPLVDNLWWRAWHLEGCRQRCADRSIFFYVDGLELPKEHQVTGHDPAWLYGSTCDLRVVHFMRHPVDMLRSGYLYHRTCPDGTPRRGKDVYQGVVPDGWRNHSLCLQTPAPASPGEFAELRRRWGSHLDKLAVALGLAAEACTPLCVLLAQAPTQRGVWVEALRSVRAGDGVTSLLRAHATLSEGQRACLASPPDGGARARVARLVPVCLHAATPTAAMQRDGTFVATWTNVARQLDLSEAALVRLLGQLSGNYEARKAEEEARPNGPGLKPDRAELNAHARAALRQLLADDASLLQRLESLPCAEAVAVSDETADPVPTRVVITGHGRPTAEINR